MKPTFYPGRLIFMLATFYLMAFFQDVWVGLLFGMTMAFVNMRLFPWLVYHDTGE